jgi:hypothetical protein
MGVEDIIWRNVACLDSISRSSENLDNIPNLDNGTNTPSLESRSCLHSRDCIILHHRPHFINHVIHCRN